MKTNQRFFTKLLLIAFLISLNVITKAQSCKDSYNNTLSIYKKGQFESINDYLTNCINEFKNNRLDYIGNRNGKNIDLVFKVYKMIINSYKNIDKDNLAKKKLDELKEFIGNAYTPDQIQQRIDNTSLDFIR